MERDIWFLVKMLEGAMKDGEEKHVTELEQYCFGVFTKTEVKAMVLELMLRGVLEMTKDRKVRMADLTANG